MASSGYNLLSAASKWGINNIGKIDANMYKNASKLEEMLALNMINQKDIDIVLGRLNRFCPSNRVSSLMTDYFSKSNPSVNDISVKYNLSSSRVYNLVTELYKLVLKDWVLESLEKGWPAFSNKMNTYCVRVRQGTRDNIPLRVSDFLFSENVEVQIIRNKLGIRNDSIASVMICYDNLCSQFKRGELVSLSVADLKVLAKALFDATLLDKDAYYEVSGISTPVSNNSVSQTSAVKKSVSTSLEMSWFAGMIALAKNVNKQDVVTLNRIKENCREDVVLPMLEQDFTLVERHILTGFFKDKMSLYDISQKYSVSSRDVVKVIGHALDIFANIPI